MRRRLLLTYLALMSLVLVALELPLLRSYAMGEFHHLFIKQLNETASVSALAEPLLSQQDPAALSKELADREARTGVAAVVLSTSGVQIARSPTTVDLTTPERAAQVREALLGRRPSALTYPYDLRSEPLVVVAPIVRGTQVMGVVATGVPTEGLRDTVLKRIFLLLLAGLIALCAAGLVAVTLTRWMLRPVQQLDDAATALAAGRHDARVPAEEGPPEIRTLARAFNRMATELEEVITAQRTFIADASHQLRNPLTALRLRVDILRSVVDDHHPAADAAGAAAEEAERLSGILDQLLVLARTDGQIEVPVPTDLAAVLTQRHAGWQVAALRRAVDLELDEVHPVVAALGPGLLEQILDNLIDNALRFAPPGSRVRLGTARTGEQACLWVEDEGPGMPVEELRRATDRFWRSPTAVQGSGTGLGLAIVERLVRSAHGTVDLTNVEPHGLRVELTFPLLRLSDDANWAVPSGPRQMSAADRPGPAAQ